MILVIGGVYQGKLDYALSRFGLMEADVYRCADDDTTPPFGKKVIYELDKWLLALTASGANTSEPVSRFIADNPCSVIIVNDISCGVVPMDPIMRSWREAVGRALSKITNESNEVVRLFCGISTRIK